MDIVELDLHKRASQLASVGARASPRTLA